VSVRLDGFALSPENAGFEPADRRQLHFLVEPSMPPLVVRLVST
jgi:hypothetical protein